LDDFVKDTIDSNSIDFQDERTVEVDGMEDPDDEVNEMGFEDAEFGDTNNDFSLSF